MKNIVKIFLVAIIVSGLWSCKKEENKVVFLGGKVPVLSSNLGQELLPLSIDRKNETAFKLLWTNPDYKFNTGISSQDVSYTLQFDKAGANFSSPDIQEKSLSRDLSYSPTIGEINSYMAKLGLTINQLHKMEIRVKSGFSGGAETLYSNVLTFSAAPYLDVAVKLPSSGELYITGNATKGDWSNSPPADQKFTQVSNTLYEIVVPLTGGNSYTFLAVYGSWDFKYSIKVKNDPAMVNGGAFQEGGEDILAPAESGNYKISVNFVTGKFTVTKV